MIKMVFTLPDFISSAAVNIFFLIKCLQSLLVKKITHHNPVEVNNAVMTISWNDEDDDPFEFKMKNIQNFKNAFKLFPRLAKALKLR